MLIEHRAYTLRPGNLDAFLTAQTVRGFERVRPIMECLIGYFVTQGGPETQIVHLYNFASYDDWTRRLHGLYGIKELEPYFKTVRPLMLAQENKFLVPAPIAELTPRWGNGNNWLPADGPILGRLGKATSNLVEESTLILTPGALVAYWQAYREQGLQAGSLATANLLGCFYCLVGRQHQVVHYRAYADYPALRSHRDALAANASWQAFQRVVAPLVMSAETKIMEPAPLAPMSPLFAGA
jgi:NIPSNAP